ncbi:MAG TPA: AsmA-like C-terminal region-containing protein [Flavobacteriales bacterium]
MNKILKRILIGLLSIVLLFGSGVFIVLRYFEEDVIALAKEEAKNYFVTDVSFGKTGLTYWKTFPNASIVVEDVYIPETFKTGDTLFYADKVFLEFGLLDLFRGKYSIHAVKADNALGRLKVDAKGADNWHFWKTSDDKSNDFKLELQRITLNNTRFSLDHKKNEFFMQLNAESAVGKGNFSSSQFTLDVSLEGRLHHLKSGKEDYAIDKNIEIKGQLDANMENAIYTFKKSKLKVEKMPFIIHGIVNTSEKSSIDLTINSDDLNLKEVVASLNPTQQAKLKDYHANGSVRAEIKIKGNTYGKNVPVTDVHFVVNDGVLRHKPSDLKFDDLTCEMRFVSGEKENTLSIRSIKSRLEAGYVDVQGIIKNLNDPVLDLSVNAQTDLQNLKRFFAWDTLEICSGHIAAHARITGNLKYIEADSAYNWKALNTTGTAHLKDAKAKLKNSNRFFSKVDSEISFDNRDVSVKNFSGEVNGSDFTINGSIKNLVPFLTTTNEHLYLNAKLHSRLLDFTNLVETSGSTSNKTEYYFELPERIDFALNTTIDKFIFRKFEANQVKGIATLDGFKLTIDPVSFQTADGTFNAQIAMSQNTDNNYKLNCLATLKNINIQKLFTAFENFDQTFITDAHLRGVTNANVQFRTTVSKALEINPAKVESLIDISIDNGQLIGLESLQQVATYVKNNKLSAPFVNADKFAERLKHISFSRMENVIEIKNNTIIIPAMDIKSSALDISARGKHTFDNKIDYTIGFNLRDVLVRKEREYEVADDGLGKKLFVYMRGTIDNPTFGIDKEVAREVRQQERQAEKQNVKALLKEELGLFKKNKDVGSYKEEPEQKPGSKMTIEWEDADPAPKNQPTPPVKQQTSEPQKTADDKKKKTPKWLQERE